LVVEYLVEMELLMELSMEKSGVLDLALVRKEEVEPLLVERLG
jgi:hypothetical protein